MASLGKEIIGFLNNPSVNEIMLNPDGSLFIDQHSKGLVKTDYIFSAKETERVVKVVAGINEQVINKNNPVISTNLPYFSARFQGWTPPACSAPSFSIRKHTHINMSLDDWVKKGSISQKIYDYLQNILNEKKNIVICGGTGVGKTTLANSLLNFIHTKQERIITIEDTAELQISGKNHVPLFATHGMTVHDCLKGALRMRPDRIIIGEVRDGAALDLLKSWNTGHGGGIATIHANSVYGALQRLEDLTLEVVSKPPKRLIAEVVNTIVTMKRTENIGISIHKVAELDGIKDNSYIIKEIK